MNTPKNTPESISEVKRQRTTRRNGVITMVLLLVALLAGSSATNLPADDLTIKDYLWGGLTVLSFAALLGTLYVAYKQSDERQRLTQLKATSLTFVAVIFSLLTAQVLQALDIVASRVSVQVIVAAGILLWFSLVKAAERRNN